MRRNIKRKFIATLCAVTMIVGNMSISTYADDAALKITKQPTEANPTVTVNKDDATYQWYKASEGDKYTVADIAGTIVGDNIIAATGNSGDVNCEVDGVWTGYNVSAYVGVEAGDIIKVTQLGDYENAPCFHAKGITLEDDGTGVYTYTATSSFASQLCIAIEDATVSGKIEIVRDGVTYPVVNGMDEVVDEKIAGKPQSNTTFSDGLWYSYSTGRLCVDVYLEEGQMLKVTGDEDCFADMDCYSLLGYAGATVASVDNVYQYCAEEDGIYRLSIDNGISFKVKAEVIDIVRGQAVAGQTTNTLTSIEEGEMYSCLVTCGEEEVWSEYIVAEMAIAKQPTSMEPTVKVNYPDEVESYQWYGKSDVVLDLIYDDDAATDGEIEAENVWTGEYFDGIWHSEDGLIDVAVVANKGDKVIITLPDDFDGVVYDYDTEGEFVYTNGVYEYVIDSANGYLNFVIESDVEFVAKIQVETFTLGEAITTEKTATLNNGELGKKYICEVTCEDGEILWSDYVTMDIDIASQPIATNPTVEVNFPDEVAGYQWYTVELESIEVVDESAANSSNVIGAQAMDGVYEDGVWTAEVLDVNGYSDIIVIFEATAGYTIKIVPSTDAIEDTMCQSQAGSEKLKCEDGVYYFEVETSGEYAVGLLSLEEFTAEITVEKMTKGEAVEGQTTNKLTNHEVGNYICEVTLSDDTVLLSNIVSIAEADITHTYTDMYDADCNDCGATRVVPERETETTTDADGSGVGTGTDAGTGVVSPNTADGVDMMLILFIACAGVVGTLLIPVFDKKRYQ